MTGSPDWPIPDLPLVTEDEPAEPVARDRTVTLAYLAIGVVTAVLAVVLVIVPLAQDWADTFRALIRGS